MTAGRLSIIHVDLDAFFAAVEQRDRPELRGKPVIVGGDPRSRGVVSTCSYEARKFGVHSAMPLRTALQLCPSGIFLPVDGAKYQRVSREVMAVLRRFTPVVEQVSIDEAFLDVAGSEALFGTAPEIARRIKREVVDATQLTVSVGVATTKLVAKVGSDLRKPDGLVVVEPGQEAAFLAPLEIRRLWGIGPKTADRLYGLGVRTIGELAALPVETLGRVLGEHGATLHDRALGIDPDPVIGGGEAAKSVSHETTFALDVTDPAEIERTLLALTEGVSARLRAAGIRAGTVAVKIRDSQFRTITRQKTLPEPSDLTDTIWRAALELTRPEVRGKKIRLLGVAATQLKAPEQISMFEVVDERQRRVVAATDAVRRRFGERAVTRASLLHRGLPAPFERDPASAVEGRVGVPKIEDDAE
ncbi:MAG: DNA polymerase IV [Candidatus Limnocylindrales bacterium]|jgi:nucleotidyltransferase/DNA polymerase involved in DNA repair